MIIKKENQLGLNFNQYIKDQFYKIHSQKYFDHLPADFVAPFRKQWIDILSDTGNKNLLFASTAMDIAEKIRVDKFQPSILKIKHEKKLTFLIDDKHFYRVNLRQDEIMVLHIKKQLIDGVRDYVSYDSFKIMPLLNTVVYPPNQKGYLTDKYFVEFLKLLIFTEYSDLKETVLKPKQSYGTRKQGKYLNETTQDFILVDSTWNNIVIRKEGFGVSGHLRLQAVGANREDRKLIYISEYYKNGYIRGAKKGQIE